MRYGETPKRTKIRRVSGDSDAAQGNSTRLEGKALREWNKTAYRRKGWVRRADGTWGPPDQGFYKGKRNVRS